MRVCCVTCVLGVILFEKSEFDFDPHAVFPGEIWDNASRNGTGLCAALNDSHRGDWDSVCMYIVLGETFQHSKHTLFARQLH